MKEVPQLLSCKPVVQSLLYTSVNAINNLVIDDVMNI